MIATFTEKEISLRKVRWLNFGIHKNIKEFYQEGDIIYLLAPPMQERGFMFFVGLGRYADCYIQVKRDEKIIYHELVDPMHIVFR